MHIIFFGIVLLSFTPSSPHSLYSGQYFGDRKCSVSRGFAVLYMNNAFIIGNNRLYNKTYNHTNVHRYLS